jgi:hypothetical protein
MKSFFKTIVFGLLILLFSLNSCNKAAPIVITSIVTDITSSSAISGGTVTNEGSDAVYERGVCWSKDPTPLTSDDTTIDGNGTGSFVSQLSDLSPSTIYYIRSYASNSAGTSFGNELNFTTGSSGSSTGGQIVADHTVVENYDKIPQQYIDSVKKMLVWAAGMSHSIGHQHGLNLLELLDSRYQVTTWMTVTPPSKTNQYLRLGRPQMSSAGMWSSEYWRGYHCDLMLGQKNAGNPYRVFLYTWCYDMTWHNDPGGTKDPVYNVRWAGDSEFGTGSYYRWGLDSGDESLTGNSVSMGTYLNSIEYINSDAVNDGYRTSAVFTTGPVDENSGTENGFQRELKNDYIRTYISSHPTAVLFDYADILSYNNSSVKNIVYWNDGGNMRPHAQIHADNLKDYDAMWNIISPDGTGDPLGEDHIGEVGALRLAKAMWWMLARIAGWDGSIVTGTEDLSLDMLWSPGIELSKDKLRIELTDSGSPSTVSLYNLYGTQVEIKKAFGNIIEFNISQLTPGVYFIVLSESKVKKTHKIIIP